MQLPNWNCTVAPFFMMHSRLHLHKQHTGIQHAATTSGFLALKPCLLLQGFSLKDFTAGQPSLHPLFYKKSILRTTVTTHNNITDFSRPTNVHRILDEMQAYTHEKRGGDRWLRAGNWRKPLYKQATTSCIDRLRNFNSKVDLLTTVYYLKESISSSFIGSLLSFSSTGTFFLARTKLTCFSRNIGSTVLHVTSALAYSTIL